MKHIDYTTFSFNATLNKSLDKILPMNPATGLRDDLVHKYEVALTDSERSHLEQYLEVQQISNPAKQLSDTDLISLCPSRYLATISDVRELATQMRKVVSDLDKSDADTQPDDVHSSSSPVPSSPVSGSLSK